MITYYSFNKKIEGSNSKFLFWVLKKNVLDCLKSKQNNNNATVTFDSR